MQKIKGINLNLPMHTEVYNIGDTDFIDGEFREITDIKDSGIKTKNGLDLFLEVYVEGKLFKRIINTPLTITYSLEEN